MITVFLAFALLSAAGEQVEVTIPMSNAETTAFNSLDKCVQRSAVRLEASDASISDILRSAFVACNSQQFYLKKAIREEGIKRGRTSTKLHSQLFSASAELVRDTARLKLLERRAARKSK